MSRKLLIGLVVVIMLLVAAQAGSVGLGFSQDDDQGGLDADAVEGLMEQRFAAVRRLGASLLRGVTPEELACEPPSVLRALDGQAWLAFNDRIDTCTLEVRPNRWFDRRSLQLTCPPDVTLAITIHGVDGDGEDTEGDYELPNEDSPRHPFEGSWVVRTGDRIEVECAGADTDGVRVAVGR